MYRLAYRNFGDHESLVVNHSVTRRQLGRHPLVRAAQTRAGRRPSTSRAPTRPTRRTAGWAAIAMDRAGNIALGYSASSASTNPAIRYTGRLASDPLDADARARATLIDGRRLADRLRLRRWGDYSSMTRRPHRRLHVLVHERVPRRRRRLQLADAHRLVHLPELHDAPGRQRLLAGRQPGRLDRPSGQSGTATVATSVTAGAAENVTLTATGQPAATNVSFSPASVAAGSSSSMTVAGREFAGGTYTIAVTGTSRARPTRRWSR